MINNAEPAPTDGLSEEDKLARDIILIHLKLNQIVGCARALIEGMRPAGTSGHQVLVLTSDIAKLAHAIKKASEPK